MSLRAVEAGSPRNKNHLPVSYLFIYLFLTFHILAPLHVLSMSSAVVFVCSISGSMQWDQRVGGFVVVVVVVVVVLVRADMRKLTVLL